MVNKMTPHLYQYLYIHINRIIYILMNKNLIWEEKLGDTMTNTTGIAKSLDFYLLKRRFKKKE